MISTSYSPRILDKGIESFTFHVLGYVFVMEFTLMLIWYMLFGIWSEHIISMDLSILAGIVVGILFLVLFKTPNKVHVTSGIMTISVIWLVSSAIGMLPYMAYGMAPSVSFFESISGTTTCGLSVITDLSAIPDSILIWRSMTGWMGGFLFIVVFSLLLTFFGLGGRFLVSADDGMSRTFTKDMKGLVGKFALVYAGLTFAMGIVLIILGNDHLTSLCLSMSSISTTGFAVSNDELISLSYPSKIAIGIFMFLGATNFITTFSAIIKRSVNPFKNDPEFRYMSWYFLIACIILVLILIPSEFEFYKWENFVDTVLTTLSIATTTGFVFNTFEWPLSAMLLFIILAVIGGSINSASGGIKITRLILIVRFIINNIKRVSSPNQVFVVKYNKQSVNMATVYSSIVMMILFILTVGAGAVVMTLTGTDIRTALVLSVSSITTVGTGLFNLGNIESINLACNIILCVLMWIGRLEILLALMLFTPGFWSEYFISHLNKIKRTLGDMRQGF